MVHPSLVAAALLAAGQAAPSPAPTPPAAPELELVGPDAGAVRTPSAPDAWGGPRTGQEPTLSQRVADYQLRAVLDPVKHTVDGTGKLTWRNRSAVPVKAVYLHLYLNAFESDGSTFQTEKRRYGAFRTDVSLEEGEWGRIELRSVKQGGKECARTFVHPDGGPETDHTVVRVDLPEAVPPGGSTVLDLAFFDQLPRVMARTGYFDTFHLVGQWYPKIGVLELPGERGATKPRWNCHEFHLHSEFYADFGAYDLEVVAPAGYTVAASGVRQGAAETGKEGLVTHRFRVEDVHDVVFTAWDGYPKPLVATYRGPGSPEVQVECFYAPEYAAAAQESLDATVAALGYFSRTLGPYPYPHVSVIVPPYNAFEAGGMEYETFFTSAATNAFPFNAVGAARFVSVHEFGHGYFMGLLASNEFEEPFLDEGLNEWWDNRMLEGQPWDMKTPAALKFLGAKDFQLDGWLMERPSAAADRTPADTIAGNSWHRWSSGSYGMVYGRTATAFQDLAGLIGDETAAAAMKLYYQRWHHRHPSTADLHQAFLDAAGTDARRAIVDRWFEEQVFGAKPVDDRVEGVASTEVLPGLGLVPGEDGKVAELKDEARDEQVSKARKAWKKEHGEPDEKKPGPFKWRSVVKLRRYGAAVPREVVLTYMDGSTEKVPWPPGERWLRLEVVRDTKVREAALTPEKGFQLEVDRTATARLREPKHGVSARVALGAESFLRVLLSLVEAL